VPIQPAVAQVASLWLEHLAQINITGGVLNFNDSQYIKADQIPSIIRQGAKQGEAQAMRKLQMSPTARRRVGI